jgi:hypothetical protein
LHPTLAPTDGRPSLAHNPVQVVEDCADTSSLPLFLHSGYLTFLTVRLVGYSVLEAVCVFADIICFDISIYLSVRDCRKSRISRGLQRI